MAIWNQMRIGDLCSTISETYRGNDPEVVLINTSDILEGQVLNHKKVENKKLKGQFKKTFQREDILFSEIRPANKRFAFIDFDDTSLYIASTKLMVLRPNRKYILPKYLYAILKSERILAELQQLAESRSGTFPQITFSSELAPMIVPVPDIETQQKIITCLDMLESKIMNDSQQIDNLEEQAQTLFKIMFVDKKSTSWKEGTFSELIETTVGGDWGKDCPTGGYTEEVYCIRGADIPEIKKGNKGKMPTRYIDVFFLHGGSPSVELLIAAQLFCRICHYPAQVIHKGFDFCFL